MAYITRNVDILDLQPSVGVGISIPFNGATGINTTYTTQDAIKSNLLNFLLTGKRERIMNPGFGSGLRDIIFNPLTENLVEEIENLIINGIDTFFPNVIVNDLNVQLEQQSNTTIIALNYSLANTNIEDELQINMNNGGI